MAVKELWRRLNLATRKGVRRSGSAAWVIMLDTDSPLLCPARLGRVILSRLKVVQRLLVGEAIVGKFLDSLGLELLRLPSFVLMSTKRLSKGASFPCYAGV